ncbi:MAG: hypothetical protein H7831_14740 [Magnetococcus sp. WYHC-3]
MLLDLSNYKLAKIVKKDLPVAIARVEYSLKLLEPYKRYKAVANCIRTLKEERDTLKNHLATYDKIEKEKGKK